MEENEVAIAFPFDEYHVEKINKLWEANKINYTDFKFIPIQYNSIIGEYPYEYEIQLETDVPHIFLVIRLYDNANQDQIKKWFESECFKVVGISETITCAEWHNGIKFEQVYATETTKYKHTNTIKRRDI